MISFFGKKHTSTGAGFSTVALEPSQPWSIFMENIQSYIPIGTPPVDLNWKIVADVILNAQYTVCAIIQRLMEDGAL